MRFAFIARNDLPGIEEDARFAKEHGFEGLEFNYWGEFKDLSAEAVGEMRKLLDAAGVKAAALGLWGWNHISPDPAEREAAHVMLNRALDFAQTLGAEVLITGGGDLPGAPLAEKVAQFASVFPPFLDRMAQAGLKFAAYAVHGNSFFDSAEAYEAVWEQFPQVGIKFDPANWMHHGDDYLAVLHKHGDKVAYMHIKEHLYLGGELASQPAAGMGDIEWGKVMAFLYEHNYAGYLSEEPHGPLWSWGPLREKMLLLSKRHIEQFLM